MRTLHLPALCSSINEAGSSLNLVLEDACDACDTPDDGVQAWRCTLEGGCVDAVELWQEILRARPAAYGYELLRRLAPIPEGGADTYASMTLYRMLPGNEPVNAACAFMGEHGPCFLCHWGGEDIPASPDLEIVSESFGLTVRWSPRAERWLHVADGISCYAIRSGADMGVSEEN